MNNCLFTVKNKITDTRTNVYGVRDHYQTEYADFLIWRDIPDEEAYRGFQWVPSRDYIPDSISTDYDEKIIYQ